MKTVNAPNALEAWVSTLELAALGNPALAGLGYIVFFAALVFACGFFAAWAARSL